MPKLKKQDGFTLVELAIVMIIIGLLIGGVLKGQELINNAQVTATVTKIQSIQVSIKTFEDMFSSFPGDIENPPARLPSCLASIPCGGTLGSSALGDGVLDESPGVWPGDNTETLAFWGQLAAAELITGINLNPISPTINGGDELLDADSGGVFNIGFTTGRMADLPGLEATDYQPRYGHYLSIQAQGSDVSSSASSGSLSPTLVARIDRKIDDGQPNSGSLAVTGPPDVCSTGSGNNDIYAEYESATACALYYRLFQ